MYFHYCGGELEKIDFVTKGKSCCDESESDAPEENDGCCKDKTLVLQNAKEALIKKDERVVKQFFIQLFASVPQFNSHAHLSDKGTASYRVLTPSLLNQQKLISTFLLRI